MIITVHRKAVVVLAAALACVLLAPGVSRAADTFPSQDACGVVNNNMPSGDCGHFTQVFADSFNSDTAPKGSFSNCAGDGDFRCAGLSSYGSMYANWGAYPSGWYDTANPKNHSNGNTRTFGGEYRADDTTWVYKSGADGQLRVHMYRPASGDNHVSAVVPRKCMNLHYGKFSERLIVRTGTAGFKLAHLHYGNDDSEIDYPEAGGNFSTDPVSWFTHGFDEDGGDVASNSAWTSWHTYSQEVTPAGVKFFLDGALVGQTTADYPATTPWVLQNESALDGAYAAVGASVDIDTTWVTCYSYAG
jgi:hypothetical protein